MSVKVDIYIRIDIFADKFVVGNVSELETPRYKILNINVKIQFTHSSLLNPIYTFTKKLVVYRMYSDYNIQIFISKYFKLSKSS